MYPSIVATLYGAFFQRFIFSALFEIGFYAFNAGLPFVIKGMVSILQDPNGYSFCTHGSTLSCGSISRVDTFVPPIHADLRSYTEGGIYCALLFVLPGLASLCINLKFYHVIRVGTKCRTALMTAVYAKSLRLSQCGRFFFRIFSIF